MKETKILYWGDGTINMAEYLHYLYVEAVLGDKSCVDKIYWCLKSIERLSLSAYEDEKMKNPKVYFKYEPGFFLRDDISVNSVTTAVTPTTPAKVAKFAA